MKHSTELNRKAHHRAMGLVLSLLCLSQFASAETAVPVALDQDAELAARAMAVFGKQKGQSFDARAVVMSGAPMRTDSMSVTLAPGKGAEVKAILAKGQSLVFHWTATSEVAVDMHGERKDANEEYTSYAVEGSQKQASGTLTAPFDGSHGWYWKNQGKQTVTVRVSVTGFQAKLMRPGQP